MIKLVLFMAAGVIFMNTHALDLNEIRGYGRKKPLLAGIFAVGALAIGGIPFFGGYISKTLLHESIVEYAGGIGFTAIEWIFLISGGMTVAYMTKLFLAIFVEQNEDREKQKKFDAQKHYMNAESTFALGGSALVLFALGTVPASDYGPDGCAWAELLPSGGGRGARFVLQPEKSIRRRNFDPDRSDGVYSADPGIPDAGGERGGKSELLCKNSEAWKGAEKISFHAELRYEALRESLAFVA